MIVYGATCLWWDDINKAAKTDSGLPICPHCGGPLFEFDGTEETWYSEAVRFEVTTRPGYVALLTWLQGRCFKTLEGAQTTYNRRSA